MLHRLLCLAAMLRPANSCSNFVASKGATADRSTHVAYNSDGQSFYGYMTHLPAGEHAPDEIRHMWEFGTGRYMGAIPEASRTYNVIGNMNEHQVSLAETTFDGIESLAQQPGAISALQGGIAWGVSVHPCVCLPCVPAVDRAVLLYKHTVSRYMHSLCA